MSILSRASHRVNIDAMAEDLSPVDDIDRAPVSAADRAAYHQWLAESGDPGHFPGTTPIDAYGPEPSDDGDVLDVADLWPADLVPGPYTVGIAGDPFNPFDGFFVHNDELDEPVSWHQSARDALALANELNAARAEVEAEDDEIDPDSVRDVSSKNPTTDQDQIHYRGNRRS